MRDRHRTETERNTVDADIKTKWQTPNCVSHPASNPSCLNQNTHTSRTRKQSSLTINTDTHVGKYGAQTHRFLSKSAHRLGLSKPNAEANSSRRCNAKLSTSTTICTAPISPRENPSPYGSIYNAFNVHHLIYRAGRRQFGQRLHS